MMTHKRSARRGVAAKGRDDKRAAYRDAKIATIASEGAESDEYTRYQIVHIVDAFISMTTNRFPVNKAAAPTYFRFGQLTNDGACPRAFPFLALLYRTSLYGYTAAIRSFIVRDTTSAKALCTRRNATAECALFTSPRL